MVLNPLKRKTPDVYLNQTLQTQRFTLLPCNWWQAYKHSLPLAKDPEALHALAYDRTSFSNLRWALQISIPNKRTVFLHAITPKGSTQSIGVHGLSIDTSGTASMMIAVLDKDWWGKGVFEEVRTAVLDHFSQSPDVVRFAGQVLARNVSSVYNYKKLGFRLVGHEKKVWLSPLTKEHMDMMVFEYLAEDWRQARNLEVR